MLTDPRTEPRTDGRTDTPSYRDTTARLKNKRYMIASRNETTVLLRREVNENRIQFDTKEDVILKNERLILSKFTW